MAKRKLRFNFIDLLLLLLAAAAVFILFVVFAPGVMKSDGNKETVNIQYVVEIQNVDEAFENLIEGGQPVEDAITRKKIGIVEGPEWEDYRMVTFDYDKQEEVLSNVNGRKTVKVTIRAEAVKDVDAYKVNDVVIRVGKQYSLIFPTMYGVGYCTSLTEDKPAK